MRRRFVQILLNSRCRGTGVLLDSDVRITPDSRLRLRLIVARNRAAMREVALQLDPKPLARGVFAFCNPLFYDVKGRSGAVVRQHFDRRYFALMVFSKTDLDLEVVAHESGHAAIFYARRVKHNKWDGRVAYDDDYPQDAICYPLGHIVAAVTKELHRNGLMTAHA